MIKAESANISSGFSGISYSGSDDRRIFGRCAIVACTREGIGLSLIPTESSDDNVVDNKDR